MATKKLVRTGLLIAWLALTIYLSLQPGTESGETSRWLARRVADIFGISTAQFGSFHAWLREMAHCGVHMVLAILAYRSLVLYVGVKRALIWTFIGCGVVAICDEAAQLVATGRASEMVDALMNLLGVETGMIIGYLITKDKS